MVMTHCVLGAAEHFQALELYSLLFEHDTFSLESDEYSEGLLDLMCPWLSSNVLVEK